MFSSACYKFNCKILLIWKVVVLLVVAGVGGVIVVVVVADGVGGKVEPLKFAKVLNATKNAVLKH